MLEEEYYSVLDSLSSLPFRLPQEGVKFRYGKFSVCTNRDMDNKLLYNIRLEYGEKYAFNTMTICPKNNEPGFTIKEMSFTFAEASDFINELNKRLRIPKKVSIQEGVYIGLLQESKQSCLVCLNAYNQDSGIHVYSCGHHVHLDCYTLAEFIRICPLCKK